MMGILFEVKVLELDDGYRLEYKGEKSFWEWRYGHNFSLGADGRYITNAGFCTIKVKDIPTGFEVDFIGDKKRISDMIIRNLPN